MVGSVGLIGRMGLVSRRVTSGGGSGGGGGGGNPPLDNLTTVGAYSTRRLRTAYTGPCIRVRRSSDNVEANIGFGADGWLDQAALLAHVGAGNGFVTTWYDQSGVASNATQTTLANQPRIVNVGVVDVRNGRPSLVFDGLNDVLSIPSIFITDNNTFVLSVYQRLAQSVNSIDLGGSSGYANFWLTNNVLLSLLRGTSSATHGTAQTTTGMFVNTVARDNNGTVAWRNGVQLGTPQAVSNTNSVSLTAIGQASASFHNGAISEVIVGRTTLSQADRQTLERNMGAAFSITVA